MAIRRSLLMMQETELDTSPRIAEYGYYLGRSNTGTVVDESWCYTEWYYPQDSSGEQYYNIDNTTNGSHTCQYEFADGTSDWYYGSRNIKSGSNAGKVLKKIRFSIPTDSLSTCYAYNQTTGEILYAGKNSIYYGHRNISELS